MTTCLVTTSNKSKCNSETEKYHSDFVFWFFCYRYGCEKCLQNNCRSEFGPMANVQSWWQECNAYYYKCLWGSIMPLSCYSKHTHHFSISPPDIHHFFISLCDHHFVVRQAAILTISSTQPLAQLPHFFFLYAIIALEITNSRCSTILQTSSNLHHNIHHYYFLEELLRL